MTQRTLSFSMVSLLLAASMNQCSPTFREPGETASEPETDLIPAPAEVRAATRPAATAPMLSGGTLLVSRDGTRAVVSEPEQNVFQIVNLAQKSVVATIQTGESSEPGRCAEDPSGHFHCILRHGSALWSLDRNGNVLNKRRVCTEPRGVAVSASGTQIYVACQMGEFLTFGRDDLLLQNAVRVTDPSAGDSVATDLRDIVTLPSGEVWVNRFRAAEALRIDPAAGTIAQRLSPAGLKTQGIEQARAQVGWRLLAAPNGELWQLHQLHSLQGLFPKLGYQPHMCPMPPCVPTLTTVLSLLSPGGTMSPTLLDGALPLDIAVSASGRFLAIFAGNIPFPGKKTSVRSPLLLGTISDMKVKPVFTAIPVPLPLPGEAPFKAIAVAARGDGQFVIQTRDTRALYLFTAATEPLVKIPLAAERAQNETLDLFHTATSVGLSCAGCHPEGGEDGHTWNLATQSGSTPRPRRTQNLRGGLQQTAPYHWNGEFKQLGDLIQQDMQLMQGPSLSASQLDGLASWLLDQPPLWSRTLPSDQARSSKGKEIFAEKCSQCHRGAALTNNASFDLGQSPAEELQVPSLIGLASRAPYYHTGCAATLEQVFAGSCAKDPFHSAVNPQEIEPLVSYLRGL